MKLTADDLRTLISEEYLRSVPDFELNNATSSYVDQVRKMLRKHITQAYGNGPRANDAYERSEQVLEKFQEDANQLLEDTIAEFLAST